jgi:NDP-sugar pyrophosphorylase family protein
MKAMIFAAGLGTRLKPLTDTMPKALVPLAGKPLLAWQVEKLRDAGIRDIIVNVHHFPDQIIETIRANEGWGCNIMISDERDELLDTGGGLKKAVTGYGLQVTEEPILACNVDILSNIDIRALVDSYYSCSSNSSSTSLLVVSERETQRYLCFDEDGCLCGWTNVKTGELKGKDGRQLAFSGMQILSPEVLARLKELQESKFSLISFYLDAMKAVPLKAYIPEGYKMMDVGKIEQINDAERFAEQIMCTK